MTDRLVGIRVVRVPARRGSRAGWRATLWLPGQTHTVFDHAPTPGPIIDNARGLLRALVEGALRRDARRWNR